MAQPEPEQQSMTDDEIEQGRDRLAEFFEEVAEDLANETGEPKAKFWYGEDYDYDRDAKDD